MAHALEQLIDIRCHNALRGCLWKGNFVSYQNHLQVCSFERLRCKYCLTSFNDLPLFEKHNRTCLKAPVTCPFERFGCDKKILREALEEHLTSASIEHSQLVVNFHSSSNSQAVPVLPSASLSTSVDEKTEQLPVNEKSVPLMAHLAQTRTDLQLCKSELCQMRREIELLRSTIPNDGTYLWCLENVSQLFREAKDGTNPFVTSPPFYTSKGGYKLALKAYLNGDPSVKDTHLSLYVTIMPGDYDPLLPWPFVNSITLCLYDQSVKHHGVVHTMVLNTASASFQQREMLNDYFSGGVSKFCPLWKIFSNEFAYIKNDTMFIKIAIDLNNDSGLRGHTLSEITIE